MQRYVVLHKPVGQTPLACIEAWRETQPPYYQHIPLTYAGRLDPLASGKLLMLIGEECKRKDHYLGLDKEYVVQILFGLTSDSGDQLGLITDGKNLPVTRKVLQSILPPLVGEITLPYPVFSSKPVNGKPLHTWAVEDRLDEITIPNKTSTIHRVTLEAITTQTSEQVYQNALDHIERIPPVTDTRKALGNDFRRPTIRASWQAWLHNQPTNAHYTVATIRCSCSSGTYMRSLAQHIGTLCGTTALATSITRNAIGRYRGRLLGTNLWWPHY